MPRCKHTHEVYERVNLKTVRGAVMRKSVFRGSNVYSRWIWDVDYISDPVLQILNPAMAPIPASPCRYVIYSYGSHFPMYVWDMTTERWYGNIDKYSVSTSRHQTACRPPNVEHWFPTKELQNIATFGIVGYLELKLQADRNIAEQRRAA